MLWIGTSWRPARCAARQRRSPAMISNAPATPGTGRARIGWIMPFSLTEDVSSLSSSSLKFRRGLRGLGRRNSIGIFFGERGASGAAAACGFASGPARRAARPRPSRGRASSAVLFDFIVSFPVLYRYILYLYNIRAKEALSLDHLRGQFQIGLAAAAFKIIEQHWLAMRRRF